MSKVKMFAPKIGAGALSLIAIGVVMASLATSSPNQFDPDETQRGLARLLSQDTDQSSQVSTMAEIRQCVVTITKTPRSDCIENNRPGWAAQSVTHTFDLGVAERIRTAPVSAGGIVSFVFDKDDQGNSALLTRSRTCSGRISESSQQGVLPQTVTRNILLSIQSLDLDKLMEHCKSHWEQ